MAPAFDVNVKVALRKGDKVSVAKPFQINEHRYDLRLDAHQDDAGRRLSLLKTPKAKEILAFLRDSEF
jgi:hypothetical protein